MKLLNLFFVAAMMLLSLNGCAQKHEKPIEKKSENNKSNDLKNLGQATFAAGCFWHEEALFESVKGVKEAISGYAGGTTLHPSYESIESGSTGHAETVNVYYDSSVINYQTLLKVYFAGQDPTQVNGQGPDIGTQYRSIVFYRNGKEKSLAEQFIKLMNSSGKYNKPIAVQIAPMDKFWPAEDYHQNYIANNPASGYVQAVSIPEIKHFQKEYPELVKPDHKF